MCTQCRNKNRTRIEGPYKDRFIIAGRGRGFERETFCDLDCVAEFLSDNAPEFGTQGVRMSNALGGGDTVRNHYVDIGPKAKQDEAA